MCWTFVPGVLLQRIADDHTVKEETRQEAKARVQDSGQALNAHPPPLGPSTKSAIITEFRSVIWDMSTKNFEEFDYDTGERAPSRWRGSEHLPEGLRTPYSFCKEVFGRNLINDKGLQFEASIHYAIRFANAFWEPSAKQMIFGDGDGNTGFNRYAGFFKQGSFINNLDVIAHELTHTVTQFTANLKYEGRSGTLNESMSDVFRSMAVQWKNKQTVDQADWLVGKDIIYQGSESLQGSYKNSRNMRALKDPEADTSFGEQPAHMKSPHYYREYEDNGGVHINSVPNFAFYKVAMALGGYSWERAGKVWYDTLTDKRLASIFSDELGQLTAKFVDFARLSVDNTKKKFPSDHSVVKAVQRAWEDVGVL